MIQFYNPKVLWFLLLMAIPLIIHFINLHRHKVIYFSQTSFLKRVEKESRRTRKLNKLLLLIIRMVAIGFLVVGFAHPYLNNESLTAVSPKNAVILFLDNSYSMQAENRSGNVLEQAKLLAVNKVSELPETTPVKIITHNGVMSDRISPKLVSNVINKIKYAPTTISVQSFIELLKNTENLNESQIWIISDMHENYWKPFYALADSSMNIVPMQILTDIPENISIDTAWFDSPYRNAGIEQTLIVQISNRGRDYRSNIPIRFYLNDTLASLKTIDIKQGATELVSFSYSANTPGWLHGGIELDDFPITFDNQYFFSYFIQPQRTVLMIGDDDYFSPLTRLYSLSRNIVSQTVMPDYVTVSMLDSASSVIIKNVDKLSQAIFDYLLIRLANGCSVVLLADNVYDLSAETRYLSEFGFSQLSIPFECSETVNQINLQNYLFKNAILSIEKNTKMPQIRTNRKQVNANVNNTVLMSTDLGIPVLISRGKEKGVVYLFTTEVVEQSNFNKHPLFVPLFINLAQFSNQSVTHVYTLSRNLCFEIQVNNWNSNDLPQFQNVENNSSFIPNFQYHNSNLALCTHNEVNQAGVWKLSSQNRVLGSISFNYSRNESLEMSEMVNTEFISQWNVVENDGVPVVKNEKSAFALWQLFMVFALFVLFSEMLLLSRQ